MLTAFLILEAYLFKINRILTVPGNNGRWGFHFYHTRLALQNIKESFRSGFRAFIVIILSQPIRCRIKYANIDGYEEVCVSDVGDTRLAKHQCSKDSCQKDKEPAIIANQIRKALEPFAFYIQFSIYICIIQGHLV